jgi:hypothetical protein
MTLRAKERHSNHRKGIRAGRPCGSAATAIQPNEISSTASSSLARQGNRFRDIPHTVEKQFHGSAYRPIAQRDHHDRYRRHWKPKRQPAATIAAASISFFISISVFLIAPNTTAASRDCFIKRSSFSDWYTGSQRVKARLRATTVPHSSMLPTICRFLDQSVWMCKKPALAKFDKQISGTAEP